MDLGDVLFALVVGYLSIGIMCLLHPVIRHGINRLVPRAMTVEVVAMVEGNSPPSHLALRIWAFRVIVYVCYLLAWPVFCIALLRQFTAEKS
jgi:hypothetical protein